jgi:hypothetical protein
MQHRIQRIGGHGGGVGPAPATALCDHLRATETVRSAERYECIDCARVGATWVHLRTCQHCGETRCCDSSANRHASLHARESGHPVVASAEPGERWLYCYLDHAFTSY